MSNVTDIILITECGEDENLDGREDCEMGINQIDQFLKENDHNQLNSVDQYCGGEKFMQCDVFMGAFKNLNLTSFLAKVYSIDW